jgi:hypothetical protein
MTKPKPGRGYTINDSGERVPTASLKKSQGKRPTGLIYKTKGEPMKSISFRIPADLYEVYKDSPELKAKVKAKVAEMIFANFFESTDMAQSPPPEKANKAKLKRTISIDEELYEILILTITNK